MEKVKIDLKQKNTKNSFLNKVKILKKNLFSKIEEILLYLIFFLAPIFFLPFFNLPLSLNKQVFIFFSIILVLFVWLFNFINTGKAKFKKNSSLVFLSFFFLGGVLSWFVNGRDSFSILGISGNEASSLLNLFIMLVTFFLVQSIFTTREKIRIALLFFTTSSFLVALVWLLSFGGFLKIISSSSFNTIGSVNALVLFLLPGFFVLLSYFLKSKKIFNIILSLVFLIFFYFIFIVAGFVLSWYFLVFGLIVVTVLYFSNKSNFDNQKVKLFLILLILVISLIFSFSNSINKATDLRLSFKASKNIIISQYENSLSDLFFGAGPAGFNYTFLKYKENTILNADLNRLRLNSSYSGLTDYFSDLGFIDAFIFILFLFSIIFYALKFIFSEMKKGKCDVFFVGLFTAVLVLIFEFLLSAQNFTILFFVIVLSALLTSYQDKNERILSLPEKAQKIFFVLIFILIFIVLLVYISYYFSQRYISEIYFNKAQVSLNSKDTDSTLKLINKAITFYNRDDRHFLFEGNVRFVKLQDELNKKDLSDEGVKKDVFNKITKIEDLYKKAINLNKKEPNNFVALASLYEFKANFDISFLQEAQNLYKQALKLDSKNTDILFASGRVYYKNANIKEAEKIFLELRSLYPRDSNIRVYLGLSYFGLDKKDLALKELEIAKILDPENKDIDKLINNINNNKKK